MSAVPPFSLTEYRYNQSTFGGRLMHFATLSNPMLLLESSKLNDSVELLEKFKNKTLPAGTTDEQLWKARLVKESFLHPETGENIHWPFRMSGFAIANVPIIAGMFLAPPTVAQTIFWQWINQSYNAGFNYSYRNASNPSAVEGIVKSYFSACSVACGVALTLNTLVKRMKNGGGALGKLVPFVAVATASTSNVVIMRWNEAKTGIDVTDEHGNVVGKSQEAGKRALILSGATRCVLAAPILALPPLIMHFVKKIPAVTRSRAIGVPAEIGVVAACLLVALPPAVALFPQQLPIDSSKLEKRISDQFGGAPVKLFFNKGI